MSLLVDWEIISTFVCVREKFYLIYIMKTIKLAFMALLSVGLMACGADPVSERYTDYVNPMIGTGGHGHVFVGANVPFGFVQLGPTSIP